MRSSTLFAVVGVLLVCRAWSYKEDQFPILPIPQSFKTGSGGRSVAEDLQMDLTYPDGSCNQECQKVVSDAFSRVVLGSIEAQSGLPRWRLSIHPEVDAVPPAMPTPGLSSITTVTVSLTSANPYPRIGGIANGTVSEEHTINVDETGNPEVFSPTVYGALRAFETLAQLIEWNDLSNTFVISRVPLSIVDAPRFPWRGFMLDTSRHFFPVPVLERIIDSLAYFKMNVFHLHLTDSQSFPIALDSVKNHSHASYGTNAIYTKEELSELSDFGKRRGVLVVPEIDTPAHTGSWRYFGEDLVADCWDYLISLHGDYVDNKLALNPASKEVWEIIRNVLEETAEIFDSPYLHVGGDEVVTKCWETSKQINEIKEWMANNNLENFSDVERYFGLYAQKVAINAGKRPIVWDDSYTNDCTLDKNVIVHSYRSSDIYTKAIKEGYDVIQSYGYYLDKQSPICDGYCSGIHWLYAQTCNNPIKYKYIYVVLLFIDRDFYAMDPTEGLNLSEDEKKHVLGGEAAQWTEGMDAANFDGIAFSRTGAIAERLWSPSTYNDVRLFEPRSQKFRCLALRRGISQAGPLYADYCEVKGQSNRKYWRNQKKKEEDSP